jgi:uncharacterized protein (DUF779 family)
VVVYAEHPSVPGARPIHAGKYRLLTGETQITVGGLSGKPAYVSVDPFERRIEVERADNVRAIAVRGGGQAGPK